MKGISLSVPGLVAPKRSEQWKIKKIYIRQTFRISETYHLTESELNKLMNITKEAETEREARLSDFWTVQLSVVSLIVIFVRTMTDGAENASQYIHDKGVFNNRV